MSTVITEECINCGACEPECPNTAIYAASVAYELDGAKLPALSDDFFYIVPEKCTECVGFLDHEACAAACPVDCCVPDPKRPESEATLLARARSLHPDRAIADPPPSRFSKAAAEGARAPAPAQPAAAPQAAAVPVPPAAPAAKPTPPAAAAPKEAAAKPAEAKPAPAAAAPEEPAARPAEAKPAPAAAAPEEPAARPAEAKPAPVAPAAAAAPTKTPASESAAGPRDSGSAKGADPLGDFEVPILCRNCQREYRLALRWLEPGNNVRCPHCRASHSPTLEHFLLVSDRVRRHVAAGGSASNGARQSLDEDLRSISARLLSRPKPSRFGLS